MFIKIVRTENGFAIITALLFLVALTIIGIAATNTTSVEMNIAGNERIYREAFHNAEGAVIEAVEENLESSWVYEPNKGEEIPMNGDKKDINKICSQISGLDENTTYGVIDNDIPEGVAGSGHSLKVDGTVAGGSISFFDLYGQSVKNNTIVQIKMGYIKRL